MKKTFSNFLYILLNISGIFMFPKKDNFTTRKYEPSPLQNFLDFKNRLYFRYNGDLNVSENVKIWG